MTPPDQKPPPRTDMSAITEVLVYANAINCKSAFQPTIDAACAELSRLKELANEHDRHHDTLCAITAILLNGAGCWTKELLVNALTTLRDELERVKAELAEWESDAALARSNPLNETIADLRTQLADQSARVQALEADKKRLDWLNTVNGADWFSHCDYGEATRQAIDAALSQEQATPRTG